MKELAEPGASPVVDPHRAAVFAVGDEGVLAGATAGAERRPELHLPHGSGFVLVGPLNLMWLLSLVISVRGRPVVLGRVVFCGVAAAVGAGLAVCGLAAAVGVAVVVVVVLGEGVGGRVGDDAAAVVRGERVVTDEGGVEVPKERAEVVARGELEARDADLVKA